MGNSQDTRTIRGDELLALHRGEPDPEERLVRINPRRPEGGDVQGIGHEGSRQDPDRGFGLFAG